MVRADDRQVARRGKYRMTRRENRGRSGGDRTRDHLLPKQVRCRCATLRCCYLALPCAALPCRAVACHTLPCLTPLVSQRKTQRPSARCRRPRQRPEVGRGRCRSGVGLNVVFREPLVASGTGFIKRLGDARKKLSVRVPVVIVNVCKWLSEHPGREGFVLLLSVAEIARGQ